MDAGHRHRRPRLAGVRRALPLPRPDGHRQRQGRPRTRLRDRRDGPALRCSFKCVVRYSHGGRQRGFAAARAAQRRREPSSFELRCSRRWRHGATAGAGRGAHVSVQRHGPWSGRPSSWLAVTSPTTATPTTGSVRFAEGAECARYTSAPAPARRVVPERRVAARPLPRNRGSNGPRRRPTTRRRDERPRARVHLGRGGAPCADGEGLPSAWLGLYGGCLPSPRSFVLATVAASSCRPLFRPAALRLAPFALLGPLSFHGGLPRVALVL